jgi:hypothetical protein
MGSSISSHVAWTRMCGRYNLARLGEQGSAFRRLREKKKTNSAELDRLRGISLRLRKVIGVKLQSRTCMKYIQAHFY